MTARQLKTALAALDERWLDQQVLFKSGWKREHTFTAVPVSHAEAAEVSEADLYRNPDLREKLELAEQDPIFLLS